MRVRNKVKVLESNKVTFKIREGGGSSWWDSLTRKRNKVLPTLGDGTTSLHLNLRDCQESDSGSASQVVLHEEFTTGSDGYEVFTTPGVTPAGTISRDYRESGSRSESHIVLEEKVTTGCFSFLKKKKNRKGAVFMGGAVVGGLTVGTAAPAVVAAIHARDSRIVELVEQYYKDGHTIVDQWIEIGDLRHQNHSLTDVLENSLGTVQQLEEALEVSTSMTHGLATALKTSADTIGELLSALTTSTRLLMEKLAAAEELSNIQRELIHILQEHLAICTKTISGLQNSNYLLQETVVTQMKTYQELLLSYKILEFMTTHNAFATDLTLQKLLLELATHKATIASLQNTIQQSNAVANVTVWKNIATAIKEYLDISSDTGAISTILKNTRGYLESRVAADDTDLMNYLLDALPELFTAEGGVLVEKHIAIDKLLEVLQRPMHSTLANHAKDTASELAEWLYSGVLAQESQLRVQIKPCVMYVPSSEEAAMSTTQIANGCETATSVTECVAAPSSTTAALINVVVPSTQLTAANVLSAVGAATLSAFKLFAAIL